jgi:hypothetical protein
LRMAYRLVMTPANRRPDQQDNVEYIEHFETTGAHTTSEHPGGGP